MSNSQEMKAFGRRVTELMHRKGMSQSDLARAVWGSTVDTRGRDVARNRDRIGHYIRGTQMPTPQNMKKIAQALGVGIADLAPMLDRTEHPVEQPMISMVGGRADVALLQVSRVVPMDVAAKVMMLLAGAATEVDGVAHTPGATSVSGGVTISMEDVS